MSDIQVSYGEYKKAVAPDVLHSGGLGPCIAIGAIYGRKGYLIHHHPVGHDYGAFLEPFFFDLRREVKDKRKLQLYVVGGEIKASDDRIGEMRDGRNQALRSIAASGFEECIEEVRWSPAHRNQELTLLLSEGRAEIDSFDQDPLDE